MGGEKRRSRSVPYTRRIGYHILAGAREAFGRGGFLVRGVQEFYEKFDCVTAFLCHFRGSFGCLVVGFVTVLQRHVCCVDWSSYTGRGAWKFRQGRVFSARGARILREIRLCHRLPLPFSGVVRAFVWSVL